MLRTIRSRMLAAALLPVTLVVVVLVGAYWLSRLGDLDEAHTQRARLLVRQVALASEYGVFSGNSASLQAVVNAVLREQDVRAVVILDARGVVLASAGTSAAGLYSYAQESRRLSLRKVTGMDILSEPISSSSVQLDDLFAASEGGSQAPQPTLLGYAVMEVSRSSLMARERDMYLLALSVALLGVLMGGILAMRMGEGVVKPILRISKTIERIGQGDFSTSHTLDPEDPLFELQAGLNQMAIRLAWGRDEMEQRVAAVTQELRLKKEEAEGATLAKSRFLAAASHDLRQPIHALGMFVARLEQLSLDSQTRELVGSLEASVHAMQDLLDGLLDLSRLESGAVQVHMGCVNVGNVFNNLRAALEPLALDKGLRLRVRACDCWAYTDPVLLQRMLMNLGHNAVRYTERGTVLIACRKVDAGQSLRVEVWDSGIGISPEHQTEIFKEFYQVGNAGRDRAYGLGLGLNIVERSAQLLGHGVSVRSNLGCGTRISITLPVAAVPQPELLTHAPEAAVLPLGEDFRILVVEDDAAARAAIVELLGAWGYRVSAAASLAQAQDVVHKGFVPDILVSDYRLGESENGLQVIESLRSMVGHPVPACLMSGDTDGELIQAAKNAHLTLLHKPVRPAKLRSLLRRLVAAPSSSE